MTISLNVVTHLGLNLYSNVPAVLAEAVANAWDADANRVDIAITDQGRRITITDDGNGMNLDDVNQRYLLVGYERRKDLPVVTPKGRHVMGRKGIGKLSLFSIARQIDVYTTKRGERHSFRLSMDEIRRQAASPGKSFDYRPKKIGGVWPEDLHEGTRLVLTRLKKPLKHVRALRARVARRFSIIGPESGFTVAVNGSPITVDDMDFYKQVQFVWFYGARGEAYRDLCSKSIVQIPRDGRIDAGGRRISVEGWIGSVFNSRILKGRDDKDSLNKVPVLAHGKIVDEDVLEKFAEGGVYTKYLIGALEADELDADDQEDITTSARQRLREDDGRYLALVEFARGELQEIQNRWKDLRKQQGVEEARLNPAIREWFDELKGDVRTSAERLFGRISELPVDDEHAKTILYQQAVVALETFRYREKLSELDSVSPEELPALTRLFGQLDEIEGALYYRIVEERLRVIEKLQSAVAKGVRERAIQKLLYDHLWLLDQSWDRGTETPVMEESIGKAFAALKRRLKPRERRYRIDIRYKQAPGSHVVIELKKAGARITSTEIMDQLGRYEQALQKVLQGSEQNPHVEMICVLGRPPSDWTDPRQEERWRRALDERRIKVVFYLKMIEDAQKSYSRYLEKKKEVGRIRELLSRIESQGQATADPT